MGFLFSETGHPQSLAALLAKRLGLLLASLAFCLWAGFQWPLAFWPGYLVAYLFWIGISLGCLGLGLLHPLTGGRWGWAISQDLTAAHSTIPLFGIFVIPLGFMAAWVYPWARELETLNRHQQSYLAPANVLIRTLVEWLLWSVMALWLRRGYRQAVTQQTIRTSPRKAGLGLVLFWFSATSVAVDWLMSLDPSNSSSIYGAIQTLGFAVAGMAFLLFVRAWRPMARVEDRQISHDLGNLLLAFNLLWVYLVFSEYLIVWSGDLPHEIRWRLVRQQGLAAVAGFLLLAGHFLAPLGMLLSVDIKRRPKRLAWIAGLILIMRLLDIAWNVLPACPAVDYRTFLSIIGCSVLLGIFWLVLFEFHYRRLPAADVDRLAAIQTPATHSLEVAS